MDCIRHQRRWWERHRPPLSNQPGFIPYAGPRLNVLDQMAETFEEEIEKVGMSVDEIETMICETIEAERERANSVEGKNPQDDEQKRKDNRKRDSGGDSESDTPYEGGKESGSDDSNDGKKTPRKQLAQEGNNEDKNDLNQDGDVTRP